MGPSSGVRAAASAAAVLGTLLGACADPPPPGGTPGGARVPTTSPPPAAPAVVEAPESGTEPEGLGVPWEGVRDPVERRTLRERENLRLHPGLVDRDLRFHDFRPFLVAEEVLPGDGEEGPTPGAVVGAALGEHYAAFLRFLREDLGMEAPALEDMDDLRIRVVILGSAEGFRDWQGKYGSGERSEGHYQRTRDRWILLHRDRLRTTGVLGLGTHALLHAYRRHFTGLDDEAGARGRGERPGPVEGNDPRLLPGLLWAEDGLVLRLVVGPFDDPGEEAGRMRAALGAAREAGDLWPLEDLLFMNRPEMAALARVRGGGGPSEHRLFVAQAQSWLLASFLLDGGDPEYRKGFLRFLRRGMAGHHDPNEFPGSFGLPRVAADRRVRAWVEDLEGRCTSRMNEALGPPSPR